MKINKYLIQQRIPNGGNNTCGLCLLSFNNRVKALSTQCNAADFFTWANFRYLGLVHITV